MKHRVLVKSGDYDATMSQKRALLSPDEEVPRAVEVVYLATPYSLATLYSLARGEKLFSDVWVRTSSLSSYGRVCVYFCGGRLDVDRWRGEADGAVGLASSRLPAVGREVPRKVTGIWSS